MLGLFIMGMMGCNASAETDNAIKVQGSEVPEVVEKAFTAKYPNENKPNFKLDSHGNWEAHFKKKGEKYRADFSVDGAWIETENDIKPDNLPDAIKDALEANYSSYSIVETEHVTSSSKGEFYDVELKKDGEKMDVEFMENGTVIN